MLSWSRLAPNISFKVGRFATAQLSALDGDPRFYGIGIRHEIRLSKLR
jgi:hypothetical protein